MLAICTYHIEAVAADLGVAVAVRETSGGPEVIGIVTVRVLLHGGLARLHLGVTPRDI